MRFDGEGAAYIAAFSADLPSYELPLSPAAIRVGGEGLEHTAVRSVGHADGLVALDRNAFVETYELGPDSIEQRFVFATLPRTGELTVHIPLAADIGRDTDEDGLVLRAPHGDIRYSRAIAIDANGRTVDAPTGYDEHGIVIRVPAEFVASAAMPLVIDPYVTSTWLHLTQTQALEPDVVFDTHQNLWIACFQETFSASDHDVRVKAVSLTGAILIEGYADLSSADWKKPRIAFVNADDRCLVVAEVGAVGARNVRGRTVKPNGILFDLGTPLTISGSEPGEKFAPTVGGDPFPTQPSYFCVAFEREIPQLFTESEVQYALVTTSSQIAFGPVALPAAGRGDSAPALSRSNNGNTWSLVWVRDDPATFGDVLGAYISYSGFLISTFGVSAGGLGRDAAPAVSSPMNDSTTVVAFERRSIAGGQADVWVAAIRSGVIVDSANISVLENTGNQSWSQTRPSIDTDGLHALLVYQEHVPTLGHPEVRLSDLFLADDEFGVAQRYQTTGLAFAQSAPRVAASRIVPNGPNRFAVPMEIQNGLSQVIFMEQWNSAMGGSWRKYCFGDGSGSPCPCGNTGAPTQGCGNSSSSFGASLFLQGQVSTIHDTAVLTVTGVPQGQPCLFFQGTNDLAGIPFGEGLRCAGGQTTRIAIRTAVNGNASYPTAGDPSLSSAGGLLPWGGKRTYQVWYRDPSSFCNATNFNLSNGVELLWTY